MQGRMARPQDEMRAYYEKRAPEFDLWWETTGLERSREGEPIGERTLGRR